MKCFENVEKSGFGLRKFNILFFFHKSQGFNTLDFVILTKKGVIQKVLTKYMYISLALSHRQEKGINLLLLIISIISEQNMIMKIIQVSWNSGFVGNFGHVATLFSELFNCYMMSKPGATLYLLWTETIK